MIKMDVEAYEEKVLLGAQRVLANHALQVIELETVSLLASPCLLIINSKVRTTIRSV